MSGRPESVIRAGSTGPRPWVWIVFLVAVLAIPAFSLLVTTPDPEREHVVHVLDAGQVTLDGEPMSAGELGARLCAAGVADGLVEIRAPESDHPGIVEAMAAALHCGARDVHFLRDQRVR